jgi:hypothetical protein
MGERVRFHTRSVFSLKPQPLATWRDRTASQLGSHPSAWYPKQNHGHAGTTHHFADAIRNGHPTAAQCARQCLQRISARSADPGRLSLTLFRRLRNPQRLDGTPATPRSSATIPCTAKYTPPPTTPRPHRRIPQANRLPLLDAPAIPQPRPLVLVSVSAGHRNYPR